jgi:hypothetical protein
MMSIVTVPVRVLTGAILLSLASATGVVADELTGMPKDDPKDFIPPSLAAAAASGDTTPGFEPLPRWARGATMPPLPQALKPFGTKVAVLTTPPVPAHEPLAPPKEETASDTRPKVITPMPATPPAPSQDLVAISPFLQWIKANPQAAAEQARQQASIYQGGPLPGLTPGVTAGPTASGPEAQRNLRAPGAPGNTATASAANGEVPYWLPPLIDSPDFGSRSTTTDAAATPVTGSSAIYSTPQR